MCTTFHSCYPHSNYRSYLNNLFCGICWYVWVSTLQAPDSSLVLSQTTGCMPVSPHTLALGSGEVGSACIGTAIALTFLATPPDVQGCTTLWQTSFTEQTFSKHTAHTIQCLSLDNHTTVAQQQYVDNAHSYAYLRCVCVCVHMHQHASTPVDT